MEKSKLLETLTEIDGGLPIYILDDDTILYTKEDVNHVDYWYDVVSKIVADKHGILQKRILNLPYCQRRARVVGDNLYCGEKITKKLLKKIEKILDKKLRHIYDEHETRCKLNVAEFNAFRNPCPR